MWMHDILYWQVNEIQADEWMFGPIASLCTLAKIPLPLYGLGVLTKSLGLSHDFADDIATQDAGLSVTYPLTTRLGPSAGLGEAIKI